MCYDAITSRSCDFRTANPLQKYCDDGYYANGLCIALEVVQHVWLRLRHANFKGQELGTCRHSGEKQKGGISRLLLFIHTFIYVGNGRIVEAVPNKVNGGAMAGQLKKIKKNK